MKLKKSTNQTTNYLSKKQIIPLLLGMGVIFSLTACHKKPNIKAPKQERNSTIAEPENLGGIPPIPKSRAIRGDIIHPDPVILPEQ